LTRIATLIIGLTFLTSCDCYQRVEGTVIDKETGKPLQGVTVYNKNKEWSKTTTDTTGHFELSNVSGGFRCPPMTVIADFKNYDKVEIKIPAGGQKTIKMQRLALQSKTSLQLMQGLWFHDQDSLASLTINNYKWTFNYKGKQADSDDNYSISITDKLPEFVKETEKAEFFILTSKSDTLKYEILGLTDSTFSMMYFPAGKIHLYRRQK
jgi:hypothetical protein